MSIVSCFYKARPGVKGIETYVAKDKEIEELSKEELRMYSDQGRECRL